MDEKKVKGPDPQMLVPALFEAGLIGSYITLQGLRIQECRLQQKGRGMQRQKQEVKGQQMLKQEVKAQQMLEVKDQKVKEVRSTNQEVLGHGART